MKHDKVTGAGIQKLLNPFRLGKTLVKPKFRSVWGWIPKSRLNPFVADLKLTGAVGITSDKPVDNKGKEIIPAQVYVMWGEIYNR